MRFFAAIWLGGESQDKVLSAREEFKRSVAGSAMTEMDGDGMCAAVALPQEMKKANRGVISDRSSFTIVPYSLHTKDGANHDVTQDYTKRALEAFRLTRAGENEPLAPFATIRLDKEDRSLTVSQDFMGSGRVYVYEASGFVVVTNSLMRVRRALDLTCDTGALIDLASVGWVMGDRTVAREFRILSPGERCTFRLSSHGIFKERSVAVFEVPNQSSDASIDAAASALRGYAKSVISSQTKPVTIGLSGGRDSRLLAAVFLAAGSGASFMTMDNFSEETEIAKKLMSIVNGDLTIRSWTAGKAPPIFPMIQNAKDLVFLHDGHHDPATVGVTPIGKDSYLRESPMTISGAGGEMAHGHFYPPTKPGMSLESLSFDEAIETLTKRLWGYSVAKKEHRQNLSENLSASLGSARLSPAVRALDYFYLRERQRRWSSFSANFNLAAPLVNKEFSIGSFTFALEDIVTSAVHRRLTQALVLEWADVPYFKATSATPINRPQASKEEAMEVIDYAFGFDEFRQIADRDLYDRLIIGWDDQNPTRRTVYVKRAAWVAAIIDNFRE